MTDFETYFIFHFWFRGTLVAFGGFIISLNSSMHIYATKWYIVWFGFFRTFFFIAFFVVIEMEWRPKGVNLTLKKETRPVKTILWC